LDRIDRHPRDHEPSGGPGEWRRTSTVASATLNHHPLLLLAAIGDSAVPADPNGFSGEPRVEEVEPFGRPTADDNQESRFVRHPIRSPFQLSTYVRGSSGRIGHRCATFRRRLSA
jgi:hypothetical protein